ncbi:MAG: hypothetical protein RSC93_08910 [Erysipelotrichaceae bacterium]
MKNTKNKKSIPAIVLYVVAVLFLMIGAFEIFTSYEYINNMVATNGLIIKDNLPQVFNYYIANSASFFAFAIIIYALGVCVDKIHAFTTKVEVEENTCCCKEELVEPKKAPKRAKPKVKKEVEVVEETVTEENK